MKDIFFLKCTPPSTPCSAMPLCPCRILSLWCPPIQNPSAPYFVPLGFGCAEGSSTSSPEGWEQPVQRCSSAAMCWMRDKVHLSHLVWVSKPWHSPGSCSHSSVQEGRFMPGLWWGAWGDQCTCKGLLSGFLSRWKAQQHFSAGPHTTLHPGVSWTAGPNSWS